MRRTWLLMLGLAACKTGDSGDDFPILPGGGPGTGLVVDAGLVDGSRDGSGLLDGRVCLVTDLRGLACSNGADGITVTLGTETVAVANDGSFSIEPPTIANPIWRVSGLSFVPSVMPLAAGTIIPAISDTDYLDLEGANGVVPLAGQGAILARIVRNNLPLAGATATVTPAPAYAVKYDGPAVLTWPELSTASAGRVWSSGIDAGTVSLRITPPSGAAVTTSVLVEDQAITFVTINVP